MTLAEAARALALQGIAVFPLQPREKKPYGRTTGLLAASSDVALVDAWWRGEAVLPLKPDSPDQHRPVRPKPTSNIGIATGAPAGFWVLDSDGEIGATSLAALEARFGPLPVTVEGKTANGRHQCFALPGGDWPEIRNSQSKVADQIDVRGAGGYIVAAPSVHPGDVKKGVPPGRLYAWAEGRAPGEVPFAQAPDWLLELVVVREAPAAPVAPAQPRRAEAGRASRYGEAALTGACRDIETARPGSQNETLWAKGISIGALVAGGEIERAYAEAALINAGLSMLASGRPWLRNEVASAIDRAFTWAEAHPKTAPERTFAGRAPQDGTIDWEAGERRRAQPDRDLKAQADQRSEAAALELWRTARPARCALVLNWFRRLGLDPDAIPGALEGFRAHAAAMVRSEPNAHAVRTPVLLTPMRERPDDAITTLALFDLTKASSRPAGFVGPGAHGRRALLLTGLMRPGPLVVTPDFADAWALATHAARRGAPIRAVATLSLSAFAGGSRGDKWGRVNLAMPTSDPERPPWTMPPELFGPGETEVALGLRGDLRTSKLRVRKAQGGTMDVRLEDAQAARWLGSLAQQSWARLALPEGSRLKLRLLEPEAPALSFHQQLTGRGAGEGEAA